jgi:3-hydroxyacyl-CoA dehydrogenase
MSDPTNIPMFQDPDNHIVLIGAGTIGLSFAALHLQYLTDASQLTIHDTRSDLLEYVQINLQKHLPTWQHGLIFKIKLSSSDTTLSDAVSKATIIQEQGPENTPFKTQIWSMVEAYAPKSALLWSSTSGIAASIQSKNMQDKTRLLVVHPFNPPHIMPLLEIVPSPATKQEYVVQTLAFWHKRGRQPVVIHKETTGFVANRLAFALLREAVHLVNEGVVSVKEVDDIVTTSMGPRWAIAGPFKSYHAGGGAGGLEWWFQNIGNTVQQCWDDSGKENFDQRDWEKRIVQQAKEAYGVTDTAERDRLTRAVLAAASGKL